MLESKGCGTRSSGSRKVLANMALQRTGLARHASPMGYKTLLCVGALGLATMAGCGSFGSAGDTAPGDASSGQATTYFISLLRLWEGDVCFPKPLPADATGLVSCQLFYVLPPGDACAAHPGLTAPDPVFAFFAVGMTSGQATVCVATQLPSSQWVNGSCATSAQPGWCYVAGAAASPCAQRFVLSSSASPAVPYMQLSCATPAATRPFSAIDPSVVGAACTPSPERSATFAGFDRQQVTLDEGNPACGSDVCLVNHFNGRTTCPYGEDASGNSPPGVSACTVPGTSTPVRPQAPAPADGGAPDDTVPAQCTDRRSSAAVYCSCHCADFSGGIGDGTKYCSCPLGYACLPVVPLVKMDDPRAGSYCVPIRTEYHVDSCPQLCDPTSMNCP